ncbi:MAG: heavy metal translocating P-type ATPase [Burkholderiales bacterium]
MSGEDLRVYDHPAAQRGLVRSFGREREVCLLIEGIRCAGCAATNEKTLGAMPGVLGAQVNYSTHRATVRWDASRIALSQILAAVAGIGFRATPYDPAGADTKRGMERRDLLWRLFVACFGMLQVMMYALPAYIAGEGEMTADIGQLMQWASFVLTVPVVIYSAAPFFRGAWRSLVARRLGMDVPIAMGVAISFVASVVATIRGGTEVYYDSVTMFVFLLLLGRYLELLARQRASAALLHLERLVPEFAHRLTKFPRSRDTQQIPVAELKQGDLLMVKPGETFPADGVVIEGESQASEALLTGESHPVAKRIDSPIMGGAVNLTSPLLVRVTRVGADSVLSSILRLVEQGAAQKPRLVKLADRVAAHFILLVLLLAGFAGVYWMAVDASRAVLVVVAVLVATCPCALSLAMPAALTAAHGAMARIGLIGRAGHAIEALAGATDVVFDKTGTLTYGMPRLVEAHVLGPGSKDEYLCIAAALESMSEHPIAAAFRAQTTGQGAVAPGISNFRNTPGAGVAAEVNGREIRLGSAKFVADLAGCLPAREGTSNDSIIWLADPSGLLAAFRLADTPRPDALQTTSELIAMGFTLHLLSGDDCAPTTELARKLGIAHVESSATPERKLNYVRALQNAGRRVAMVGDGINDWPVLAQADVSIAMGSGTRLAQIKADAVLLEGRLSALPDSIRLARKTLRVIRQNVCWAFGYNLLVLPLAVLGELTPWAAAIGMSSSSLVVLLNALRLQRCGVGQSRDSSKLHLDTPRQIAVPAR